MAETQRSGKCGEGLTWRLEDGILFIEGSGEMVGAPWSAHTVINDEIHTVIIAPGCTRIESEAFSNFVNLTAVTIPDTVRVIGDCAFRSCGLTSVTMEGYVRQISENAFWGCTGPIHLTILSSMEKTCRKCFKSVPFVRYKEFPCLEEPWEWLHSPLNGYDRSGLCGDDLSWYQKGKELYIVGTGKMYDDGGYSFPTDRWEWFHHLYITPGCTDIGDYAFNCREEYDSYWAEVTDREESGGWGYYDERCHALESVHIPDTVKRIGFAAFEGCCRLEEVTIPGNVEEIGTWAFKNCDYLHDITIKEGVKRIGSEAFADCGWDHWSHKLYSITIPDSVTEIGEDAFRGVPHIEYHGPAQSENNWGAKHRN